MKNGLRVKREIWLHYIACTLLLFSLITMSCAVFVKWHENVMCVVWAVSMSTYYIITMRPAHRPIWTWCHDLEMKLRAFPRTATEKRSIAQWAKIQLTNAGEASRRAIRDRDDKKRVFLELEAQNFPILTPDELLAKKREFRKELSIARCELKRAEKDVKKEQKKYLRIWDLFKETNILFIGTDPVAFRDHPEAA